MTPLLPIRNDTPMKSRGDTALKSRSNTPMKTRSMTYRKPAQRDESNDTTSTELVEDDETAATTESSPRAPQHADLPNTSSNHLNTSNVTNTPLPNQTNNTTLSSHDLYPGMELEDDNTTTGPIEQSFTHDNTDMSLTQDSLISSLSLVRHTPNLHSLPTEIPLEHNYATPTNHGFEEPFFTATQFNPQYQDCTDTIHELYKLLLHLCSHPYEFDDALKYYENRAERNTLASFHADFDRLTEVDVASLCDKQNISTDKRMNRNRKSSEEFDLNESGNSGNSDNDAIPTVLLIFSPETEVVLPQAHTASQLFGIEREDGMELEGGRGIREVCRLFKRWLALMPNGDHLNIINPPGLIVMRLSQNRYRAMGAHRVIWRWNNEFIPDPTASSNFLSTAAKRSPYAKPIEDLHVGDLVSMTVGDVFETDGSGHLVSYCPTFDNRMIQKTGEKAEIIRKGSEKLRLGVTTMANSRAAEKVNKAALILGKIGYKAACRVKNTVKKKIEEEIQRDPQCNSGADVVDI